MAGKLQSTILSSYKFIIMPIEHSESKTQKEENTDSFLKPDPETTHTTDPQEHMEGPISSLMKKTEKSFESEDSAKEGKTRTDD